MLGLPLGGGQDLVALADGITQHYERYAHAFDTVRRRSFVELHWFQRFAVSLKKGNSVLDLGCGGGEPVSRFLIDSGFDLTGVDTSATMISLCRVRFPRATFVQQDMRSVMFENPFHGIVAWDSLYYLRPSEQRAMLARAAFWLKPGGRMLFNTGAANMGEIAELHRSDDHHTPLEPAEYRETFARLNFEEVAFAYQDKHTAGRTIWLLKKR